MSKQLTNDEIMKFNKSVKERNSKPAKKEKTTKEDK